MKGAIFALIGSAALLAGCTAGPDYHGPVSAAASAPEATAAFMGTAGGPFADQPVPGEWWRLYADPRLDELVREALAANTDLRVAAANIEAARAREGAVHGARQLQAGISADMLQAGDAATPPSADTAAATAATFAVGYDIDVAGRIRREIEAAHAEVGAVQAAYDLARIGVAAGVTRAYVDACAAGYRQTIAERQLALQTRSLADTKRLAAGGRGTALDTERSAEQLDRLRAAIPLLVAARQGALLRSATLTGKPPADYPRDLADCTTLPQMRGVVPVGDGAALIRRRPDIRMAERQLAAATARIGIATAELYPDVKLGSSLGLGGTFSPLGLGVPLSHIASPTSFLYTLGPLVSWNLNHSEARARIAQSGAERNAALARFDGQVLTALREVETALAIYTQDMNRAAALQQAATRAQTALGQSQRLFRAGRVGSLTMLDAERQLADQSAAIAEAQAQIAADQVTLFLALGGGWQTGN